MVNLPLGFLGTGLLSTAYGISADGTVVVGSSKLGVGWQAFRWEDLNKNAAVESEEMLGNNDGSSDSYYVELFRDGQIYLRTFLKYFGPYGEKYNIPLEHLLNLSHKYFDDKVDDSIINR